jgi:hypothetical protein
MTPVQELLADPRRWCKGWPARDTKGGGCKVDSSDAIAWSLLGALRLYYGDGRLKVYRRINQWMDQKGIVNSSGNTIPIGIWANEPNRTHAEIMGLCAELDI